MKEIARLCICCEPGTAPLDTAARDELAKGFKALGDPARVAVLNLISCREETCVCDLTAALDISQPTVSHHLRVLREAGLVRARRSGTWMYYRVVPEAVASLRQALAA